MDAQLLVCGLGAISAPFVIHKIRERLSLSRAKHPSLQGHSRMARWVAKQVPFYDYDEARFFSTDDAPADIAVRRRAGFLRLAELYRQRFPKTVRLTDDVRDGVSDLQFTAAYR